MALMNIQTFVVLGKEQRKKNMHFQNFKSILTSPETAAVAVAIAGIIFPAMRFVLNRSAGSMLYILARKFDAAVMKSICPLLSSSFSKEMGFICKSPTRRKKKEKKQKLLENRRCPKHKLQGNRTLTNTFLFIYFFNVLKRGAILKTFFSVLEGKTSLSILMLMLTVVRSE